MANETLPFSGHICCTHSLRVKRCANLRSQSASLIQGSISTIVFAVNEIQALLSILQPGFVMSRIVSEGFQWEADDVAEAQSVKVASVVLSKMLTFITSDSPPFLLFTTIDFSFHSTNIRVDSKKFTFLPRSNTLHNNQNLPIADIITTFQEPTQCHQTGQLLSLSIS